MQVTVSPAVIVSPLVMLMSDADAATAQCITNVPPDVCSAALATAEALPAALVSDVIALAVAVPVDDAAKAVADNGNVATTAPGAATVPVSLKVKLPEAPINAVTAFVAASASDINMTNGLTITAGDTVTCTSLTYTALSA